MIDEKLSIARDKVYQAVKNLDVQQTREIEKYLRKIQGKKSIKQHKQRKQERFEEIRTWEPGTKVVCSSFREPNFDGKTGKIIRHLGRGSNRSVIEFDEKISGSEIWHIPSIWLSKATPESVDRIQRDAKFNQGLGKILTKALNNMED